MNKPIVKNWMRYWASTLAISGMLVMGACGSEEQPVEEAEIVEIENVDRPVVAGEYEDEEGLVGAADAEVEAEADAEGLVENEAPAYLPPAYDDNYVDIEELLDEHPEVNEAIVTTLDEMTSEPGETNVEFDSPGYDNSGEDLGLGEGQEVSYDRVNNTILDDEDEDASYTTVYDMYLDPAQDLSPEERQLLEDAKAEMESRRASLQGQMDAQLTAYFFPAVEARPDVNYNELIEEIKEETLLPEEMDNANMEGTVLVQFVVDEMGEISNAEVIDGVIRQVKEDGTLMSFIRLSDRTQNEIKEEIEKEDLLEYKGEGKEAIIEAVTSESLRVINTTSGEWQPAMQDEQAVKMVVVLPIRFDIED